jgi:leucyl-tRNA synthetase
VGVPWDVARVEACWQARWVEARLHEVDLDAVDPVVACYNLVEFPYPSADGLHIGHAMTYAGADSWGRLQRRRGRTVFQPIGFDSFGINAENYALQVGEQPATLIARTMRTYRRQLEALGAAWSWDAAVATSDPDYYRWTQWVFLRLFDAGLAYQAEAPVLWCPTCLTVLAREQVDDDRCERCDSLVGERSMRQWFLRITAYADRLRDGLDHLDWPEPAKNRQRRWIEGMHDWLISRQRYWGPPIPIVHCDCCGPVAVPDAELPVVLPTVADTRPVGDGRSPLAQHDEWVAAACPRCGRDGSRETDVSDTFFDSSWYFLRYPSSDSRDRAWDADRTARWLPVDQYAGGPEHVARHHLYARFVTMALHDMGLVPFAEPFPRIRLHGFLTMDGAKMSKSRGNVVNPDDMIRDHGADVTRLALLFGRPWDADGDFDPAVVNGVERFLARLWRVATAAPGDDDHAPARCRAADRVADAIDAMAFNKAISALMELTSAMHKSPPSAAAQRGLVALVAPLAPHVAEELWCRLDGDFSVHAQPWPAVT